MPVSSHLLERAYQLIHANQLQNAELVLDAVVRVDPQNVEAWMIYLRICQSQNDLDWLKDRVLKTKELSEDNKTELINYYTYLTQHLNGTIETAARTDTFDYLLHDEKEKKRIEEGTKSHFELIDIYDYPIKIVINEFRTRPGRRVIYNTFARDIVNTALKKFSRTPFGRKVAAHIRKLNTLMNDLVKNPKNAYARISKWAHFEKSVGVALLAIFLLGVNLVVSGRFLGYGLLAVFVIGGGWWLVNFGSLGTGQNRIYLHEHKTNLPETKGLEIVQKKERIIKRVLRKPPNKM